MFVNPFSLVGFSLYMIEREREGTRKRDEGKIANGTKKKLFPIHKYTTQSQTNVLGKLKCRKFPKYTPRLKSKIFWKIILCIHTEKKHELPITSLYTSICITLVIFFIYLFVYYIMWNVVQQPCVEYTCNLNLYVKLLTKW